MIPSKNSFYLIVLKNTCSELRLNTGYKYYMTVKTMLKTMEVKVRAKFSSVMSLLVAHLSK